MADKKNEGVQEQGADGANGVEEQSGNISNDGNNGSNDNGADGANAADSGSGDGNGNAGNDGGEKTFTQSEVSAMMAKEKRQGYNAAFNKLGIDPEDKEGIALIQSFAKSRGEQGSADGEDGGNDELQHELMVERMKVEAMKQGVKPNFVDDIVTLAIAGMTEDADMKTLIGEYKTKYPMWFGLPDGEDESNAGKKGTGSSMNASFNKGGDNATKGMGERLAASRKGKSGKSSYFRNNGK